MGIFGWIKNKINKVAKTVGNAVTKTYKAYTGQATIEEADKLYEEIRKRFEEHKANFEKEVEDVVAQIEKQVESINKSKEIIKTELFPMFAEKMSRLKDINVTEEYLKEHFIGTTLKVGSIRERADLFLIDFKNKPFKSHFLANITFGFYTRKKAKESLEKVREEQKRVAEEIARMDSELVKLRSVNEALKLISGYFVALIDVYRCLLNRLDNSVNFLMIKCISFAHKLLKEQMSIKLLPKSQQSEIMAMYTISKILKAMVEQNITLDGKMEKVCKNVNTIERKMRQSKDEITEKAA